MSTDPVWGPVPTAAQRLVTGPGIWGVYGPPGSGKTVDQCRAFPNGLWIGVEGDFRSSAHDLQHVGKVENGTWSLTNGDTSLIKLLDKHFPGNKNPNRIPSIVIDELNTIVGRDVAMSGLRHGPAIYKALGEALNKFFDRLAKLTEAGVHVAWNAHSTRPDFEETRNGETVIKGSLEREGGPEMPGQAMRICAKRSHVLYRLDIDPGKYNHPHPFRYVADHTAGGTSAGANYFQKTRGFVDRGPLNLGEILRAEGVQVLRPPQFHDWLEARVAWAAGPAFTEDGAAGGALYTELVRGGAPEYIVQWGIGDLMARREIIKSKNLTTRLRDHFGINV